ncbi:MAG: phosphoribosylformimino-5-aminoimidazole carboxamide ribotide isomerase [Proteobacteria bacterium]|nr:phosphoribosylformimino-5-aminoimidazole carboxamide ribotide isomerase [Pseudomonadota bacterium]
MKFRPCIDLHQGVVKQIVGSTLSEDGPDSLVVNFESSRSAAWYAERYKQDDLTGGHVIRLGPGNDEAAEKALSAWPGGLQLGGGINDRNAVRWLEAGASQVIVTSHVFENGQIHEDRLKKIVGLVGKEKLVLDLSCRKKDDRYWIVTDRWRRFTDVEIDAASMDYLAQYCCEFLVHAVDVEGKSGGIEKDLLELLGKWGKIPATYAGGIHSWSDIETIYRLGNGKIDFTVGSALDIFGGQLLKYDELVEKTKIEYG